MRILVILLQLLVLLGFALSPTIAAAQPNGPVATVPSGSIELARLVDLAAQRLRINVDYDAAQLKGVVTLRLEGAVSDDELWALVNRLLAARGFTTVRAAPKAYSVVRLADAAAAVGAAGLAAPDGAPFEGPRPGFTAVTVRPAHRPAKDLVEPLGKVLSKPAGSVSALGDSGLLLVVDLADRVDAALALLRTLDVPTSIVTREIPTRHVTPQALAAAVAQVAAKREAISGEKVPGEIVALPTGSSVLLICPPEREAFWRDLAAALDQRERIETRTYPTRSHAPKDVANLVEQTLLRPGAAADERVSVIIDDLTGSVIVTATPTQHQEIAALIERLGSALAPPARIVRSFVIRNRPASELHAVLDQLLNAGAVVAPAVPEPAPADGVIPDPDLRPWPQGTRESSEASAATRQPPATAGSRPPLNGAPVVPADRAINFTIDEATNSLIAVGEARLLDQIEPLLRTLDVRQPQVMLEVLIVSLTDAQTVDLGVELQQIQISNDVRIRLASLFGLSGAQGSGNGAMPPPAGLGFTGSILSPGDFSILIRALQTINRGRSLSMPRLLVANNEQGTLNSVLDVPFASTNASNTVTTTSFGGSRPAGTQVSITPQIGTGDYLTLDYSVSLSSFAGAAANANLPPPRQENRIQSVATIPDGYTVAVGGIELQTDGTGISQVPGLARIPLLGEAFKSRSKNTSKTRFYVFIRASIMRSTTFEDLKYLSDQSVAAAEVDDGFPEVEPRVIR